MEQNEKYLDLDLDSEAQQEQEVELEEEFDLFPVLDEENMEESSPEERLPRIQNSSLNHLDPEGNDPCFQIYLVLNCAIHSGLRLVNWEFQLKSANVN